MKVGVRSLLSLISLILIIFIGSGTSFAVNDTTTPHVSSMDPVNNSCNIPVNSVLKIVFSEPVKTGTGYVELRSSNKLNVSVNKSLNNSILTIKPNTMLKIGSKYTLYLHSGSYTDLAGNPISLYSSSFTVNNPIVYSVYLQKIQTDQTINGKKYYAKYAIYQKPTNSTNWNRYLFNHIVNTAKHGVNGAENDYRIYKLQNVVLGNNIKNFPQIKSYNDLTTPGNWEKAVQLKGTALIGGMHGYETFTSINFYENGKRILPNINNPVTSCNNLQIVETSNLYNPNNPKQIVASTITTYEWNGENLKIRNIYNWKINTTVTEAYVAMFPTKNSPKVASQGEIKGFSKENFKTRTNTLHENSPMGTVWNNINNLHMSMEIINPQTALNNYTNNGNSIKGKTWFRTAGSYIKLYIGRVCLPKSEKINTKTIWDIQTIYKIWDK